MTRPAYQDSFKMVATEDGFRDEFLQDSEHFRGLNFAEWKSWMFLLAFGEDKKM